jgi:hypothetical protein
VQGSSICLPPNSGPEFLARRRIESSRMLKLLERAVASIETRLVLLSPAGTYVPDLFASCDFDFERHARLIRDVQRLRGNVYAEDGAIAADQLSADGLHQTPEDDNAWHLLMFDSRGELTACAWYREHDNNVHFGRLRLRNCGLAQTGEWRDRLWYAVERELARARQEGLRYAELGGWAVANESRHHGDALLLALSTYTLARVLGGALGITTATTRHGSSRILARIGGRPLEFEGGVLPPYYDNQYRCVMELLRFDSRAPGVKFGRLVPQVHKQFPRVAVVARPYWPTADRVDKPASVSGLLELPHRTTGSVSAA